MESKVAWYFDGYLAVIQGYLLVFRFISSYMVSLSDQIAITAKLVISLD